MRVFALTVALLFSVEAVAGDGPLILTVQVRPGASAKTLSKIAEVGVPNEVVTTNPSTVKALLTDEYGSSHQRLRDLFGKWNPSVHTEEIKAGTTVKLPAGPIWIFNVEKQTSDTLNALDLARLEMGTAGTKTLKNIAKVNDVRPSAVPKIGGGKTVTLPYVAPFVSIEIKPEYREKALQIARALMASDPAVQVAEVSTAYRLIGSLASTPAPGGTTPQGYLRPMPNDRELAKLPKMRTTVAIIDSGIGRGDARFDNLWKNPRLGPDGSDLDFVYLKDDVNGFDFVNWQAFPLDDYAIYHGTHVAGIATQRLADAASRAAINDRVELMILKVADRDGQVLQGAVDNAVAFAFERGVRVANLSFAGMPSVSLQTKFSEAKDVLFVVASGNDSLNADTNETQVYPAKFAAKLPNVLSVAALDSTTIYSNSNFGPHSIDIAAPGVGIESTVEGGSGTAKLNGSSQAAPLVAYVAALLASSGFKSPEAIRQRIIDSADVLRSLQGKVACEGTVDPEKALSFDRDLVELSDHTLKTGTIIAPVALQVSGKSVGMDQVRKIVFNYSSDPSKALRVTWVESGKRLTAATSGTFPNITLSHDGVNEVIDSSNVRDLIRKSVP